MSASTGNRGSDRSRRCNLEQYAETPAVCLITIVALASWCTPAPAQILNVTSARLADNNSAVFDLSFDVQGQKNVAAVQWGFTYAIREIWAFTVTPGPAATKADKVPVCGTPQDDTYRCVLAGMNASRIGDGVVATIRAALVPGTRSVDITLTDTAAAGVDGSVIPVAAGAGAALGFAALSSLACMSSVAVTPMTGSCNVTTATPAPSAGARIVLTTVAPIIAPASVRVPPGERSAGFQVTAPVVKSDFRGTLTATYGGASLRTSIRLLEPIHVSALECTPSTIAAGEHATCAVLLNRAPASSTVIEFSANTSGVVFPWSITLPRGVRRSTFRIDVGDRVTASGDVVFTAHTSSSSPTSSKSVSLRLALGPVLRDSGSLKPQPAPDSASHSDNDQGLIAGKCPCSLWTDPAKPAVESNSDDRPVEVGVRFRSSIDGYITAIRFYKGDGNQGPHTGHVWAATGRLLGIVSFKHETAAGWQSARLERPVQIRAGTHYVASYWAPHGRYASTPGFFRPRTRSRAVLYAPSDGDGGRNGVFHYGSQQFPADSYESTNYWVDVVVSNVATP